MVKRTAGLGGPFLFSAVGVGDQWVSVSSHLCTLPTAHCLRLYSRAMPNDQPLLNLTLQPVTPEDDPFLLAIYGSTRADELNQVVWAEGQREAFLTWQFEMQRREYDARFPDARHQLILIDDEPAGRIWVGEDKEQIRLLDISILPQFQKRGAGTMLLKDLMQEAARAGKFLRHMVFVLNNDAHRFYERLGFVVIEDVGAYKHMEYKAVKSEA